MDADFSTPIKKFIDQHIHSIAQLEVLLALHENADACWSVEQVTSSFYLQPQMASELLRDLVQRGFVAQKESAYRISYDNDAVRRLIEELAKLYRERRVSVISRIFSNPEGFPSRLPPKRQ